MAIGASQFAMSTIENETRVPGVIETRVSPGCRVVAVFALFAATAIMNVIVGVAADTGRWRILKRLIHMTVTAGRFQMAANQGVISRIVVEFDVLPFGWRMAIDTGFTHESLVRILLEVAGNTGIRRVAMFRVRFMTVCARSVQVTTGQGEVRVIVIEIVLVEGNDDSIPPFVIGVAIRAGVGLYILE